MKLLFDQHLSFRLVVLLAAEYPDSMHTRDAGLSTADDDDIWDFAAHNGLTIVSKDSDFETRAITRGHPPKVVWLRAGARSTAEIERLLRARQADLLAFQADPTASLFVLQ